MLIIGFQIGQPKNMYSSPGRKIWQFFQHMHPQTLNEEDKEHFYDILERITDEIPRLDVKIIIVDLNPQIGRESVFCPSMEK